MDGYKIASERLITSLLTALDDYKRFCGKSLFENKNIRLLCLDDMLYPTYEKQFRTITYDQFLFLQNEARTLLQTKATFLEQPIIQHLQSIIDGQIPFGWIVEDSS